ncbi:pantoate--beta-alanine ligase [Mucilaginibacter sp. HD30]
MKHFYTIQSLAQYLFPLRQKGLKIGFVPTMGALHNGHLSLINIARQQCDIVVCSIFVNPTQFNDPRDLEKYPRPIAADIQKLEQVKADILFEPAVNEMYADNEHWHLQIGDLEHLLEGASRPGHYQGVTQVVNKLFNIVKPDVAFFGQKDYQQFLVITKMVDLLHLHVKLVMCPIERETDGLAMSSRNVHLSAADRQHALILSKTLNWFAKNVGRTGIEQAVAECKKMIHAQPGVHLDYFEAANPDTLRPAQQGDTNLVALVAAKVGNTRLIDNVIIS